MAHGPDPCDDCGAFHTHVRNHYDSAGEPIIPDTEVLLVRFYGITADGQTLYVKAEYDE